MQLKKEGASYKMIEAGYFVYFVLISMTCLSFFITGCAFLYTGINRKISFENGFWRYVIAFVLIAFSILGLITILQMPAPLRG